MLIHVGYHKTGTTFLQTGLFASRVSGFVSPWNHSLIRQEIVLPSDLTWNAPVAVTRFADGFQEATHSSLHPVLSDERLCGSPHAGGFDSGRTAERLAQLFPSARVLIGIREQVDVICSTYQQYVRNGGSAPISKYLRPRHHAESPQFRFEHWEYHHLIRRYCELFAPDRVLVVPYEGLRNDTEEWCGRIHDFVGVPRSTPPEGHRYPSLSASGIAVKRQANRLLFRGALNPAAPLYMRDLERRFERLDHIWPDAISRRLRRKNREIVTEAVGDRFGPSNVATTKLSGLALRDLGYNCVSEGN